MPPDDDDRKMRVIKINNLYYRISIDLSPLHEDDADDIDDACEKCEESIISKSKFISVEDEEAYNVMRAKDLEKND